MYRPHIRKVQRLLKYETLSEYKRKDLQAIYQALDPATLLDRINHNLEKLWKSEEKRSDRNNPYRIHKIYVTGLMTQ